MAVERVKGARLLDLISSHEPWRASPQQLESIADFSHRLVLPETVLLILDLGTLPGKPEEL